MKNILAALLLAACATPSSGIENLPDLATGVIESVREVPLDIHGFREAIEHSVNPPTAQRLVIRLDDERAVTLVDESMQRFVPGERVRIISGVTRRSEF